MAWEYMTLSLRIQRKKPVVDKGIGYAEAVLDDSAEQELRELGAQGWELVSAIPVDPAEILGSSPGTQGAVAFFKRSK